MNPDAMSEFQLIDQIQRETSLSSEGVVLGIGDDAAVIEIPAGQQLVASTDTLNAGVHFPIDAKPFDIGFKSLAVNLSDLAAMGATPRWVLLSLSLPQADPGWLSDFTAGFRSLAGPFGVALVGGDTTRGSLSISVTALGVIEPGRQLQRSGAQAGDLVVVSGTVGGAARTLDLLRDPAVDTDRALLDRHLLERHLLDRPQPRVLLGRALVGKATACIDISDGLLADLGHLLTASGFAARLETAELPAPGCLDELADDQRWNYQLSGGDDYELLFTVPADHAALIQSLSKELDIRLSVIGSIVEGSGVRCFAPNGEEFQPQKSGFDHFGDKS